MEENTHLSSSCSTITSPLHAVLSDVRCAWCMIIDIVSVCMIIDIDLFKQVFLHFFLLIFLFLTCSWLFMIVHDCSWLFMIVHDCSCLFMFCYVGVTRCVTMSSIIPQRNSIQHVFLWFYIFFDMFMIIHDCSWLFMIVHDCSWLFMIVHDCSCGSYTMCEHVLYNTAT
jgi:hypothetical protein